MGGDRPCRVQQLGLRDRHHLGRPGRARAEQDDAAALRPADPRRLLRPRRELARRPFDALGNRRPVAAVRRRNEVEGARRDGDPVPRPLLGRRPVGDHRRRVEVRAGRQQGGIGRPGIDRGRPATRADHGQKDDGEGERVVDRDRHRRARRHLQVVEERRPVLDRGVQPVVTDAPIRARVLQIVTGGRREGAKPDELGERWPPPPGPAVVGHGRDRAGTSVHHPGVGVVLELEQVPRRVDEHERLVHLDPSLEPRACTRRRTGSCAALPARAGPRNPPRRRNVTPKWRG